METLNWIMLVSTLYFVWRSIRASTEPVAEAVDPDDPLAAELED